jgi:hypothetical protein
MIYPNVSAEDQAIFREEFMGRLPGQIFDSHVHVFKKEVFPPGYRLPEKSCYTKFGGEHRLEFCRQMYRDLLPGIEVKFNCFATPDPQADRTVAAALAVDNRDIFGMALLGPADSVEELSSLIAQNHLVGFKPYPNLAVASAGKPIREAQLAEFFSPAQLEYIDAAGLLCVVHIPRPERLADPLNQRQMVELCEKCPGGQFIFAHIGRAYYMQNVVGNLKDLAQCPNAWLDTAMVNHQGVLAYALEHFPRQRIIFGSDAPIAWLHGKSVEINHQYAYLMGEDFRIGNAIYDSEQVVRFAPFFYEQLRAILQLGLNQTELQNLLYQNAFELFNRTARRLYGES